MLVIKGRSDHVFKSNGRKIAPQELESLVIRCPEVLKAKCISVKCDQKGLKPVMIVELNFDEVEISSKSWKNDLVNILRKNLEAYKVPRDILVARIPQLPNGKVDHGATTELWLNTDEMLYLGKATFGCHFHQLPN